MTHRNRTHSLSLYSLTRNGHGRARHTQVKVCAWLGNEGRGGEGRAGPVFDSFLALRGVSSPQWGPDRGNFVVSVELKAFLRHVDSSIKLKLIRVLIDAWHEFFVLVLPAEVGLDYFKRFPVDFFIVVTLKEFNLV